jgi:hypothetical protein
MHQDLWADSEFKLLDLGDNRLNQRMVKLTKRFLESPESPINKACGNWNETKAAYRFFQNENIDYQDILKCHTLMTKQRANEEETILAIQDTTYLNFTHHPKTKGLGVLARHKGQNKKTILDLGLVMHSTLGVSTEGLPLGILSQQIYARQAFSPDKNDKKKKDINLTLPIEKKESNRWLEALNRTKLSLGQSDLKIVTIADREADIYELFHLAENSESQFLIRASHNRKVNKTAIHSKISGDYLWDLMNKIKTQGIIKINIPKNDKSPARLAVCDIKFDKIKVCPPKYYSGNETNKKLPLYLYAIYLKERNYSSEKESIDWMLLTNITIHGFDEALEKIKWYCLRWRIEVFHKILKSGLKVEACRLETSERLIRYLTVMSIIAWRIYWITLIARVAPASTGLIVFNDLEWKILFKKIYPHNEIPKNPPCIEKILIWIAQLGGFLARKNDGKPGIIHVWRGLNKFANIMEGVQIARNIYG